MFQILIFKIKFEDILKGLLFFYKNAMRVSKQEEIRK